jgi:2-polyprenyl-3-methyl-5-hydroxy-6-metoxy-1,4-benzoquinol methylase
MSLPDEFSGRERSRSRNNERHRHIIDANSDAIAGKRVLDLACYNGRWSFAALKAGASFVTGVEGRAESVAEGRELFKKQGVQNGYELICSDMFEYLFSAKPGTFDTIFCLGVFYHVMDHYLLTTLMTRLKPQTIIIDSGFIRSLRNYVYVHSEPTHLYKNALPKFAEQKNEVIGQVSIGLMLQMAWNLGYSCRPVIWDRASIADAPAVKDYMAGKRYTFRLEQMPGNADPDWKAAWSKALSAVNPKFAGLLDPKTHDALMDERCRQTGEFTVLEAPPSESVQADTSTAA